MWGRAVTEGSGKSQVCGHVKEQERLKTKP